MNCGAKHVIMQKVARGEQEVYWQMLWIIMYFNDWERVIVAVDNEKICGYCTVSKTDCIPDVDYTPYIGYMFVDEEYRGNRLSQKLIQYAIDYMKNVGYDKVYIVSDHENLYEKYGFRVIDRKTAPWGSEEKIYMQEF